jgi:hypothetical protein
LRPDERGCDTSMGFFVVAIVMAATFCSEAECDDIVL